MKKYIFSLILIIQAIFLSAQEVPLVLLRLDDNGMNHSVTQAIKAVADTGIPFSTSVLFTCPWYQEAVAVLKNYPNVSVGVHLALNSEWKYYRWGPVLGRSAVPSLVDKDGYFLPSTAEFLKSSYKLDEVEKELAAQIERALATGLKIDYIDYHMGTAVSTPELRAIIHTLAKKYRLGISGNLDEQYYTLFDVPIDTKKAEFMKYLNGLKPGKTNLVVMHVAQFDPEMKALIDMNNTGQHSEKDPLVAKHRAAELEALLSDDFQNFVSGKKVKLVTYSDLLKEQAKK